MSPIVSVPASGCSCAGDHPEQRGLARAVGADDADDAGRAAGRSDRSSISRRSPKPLRRPVGLDDRLAQPRARRDVDLHLLELLVAAPRRRAPRSGPGAPWTSCAGPWGSCAPTRARPRSCAGATLSGRSSCSQALLLLLQPGGVVALVGDALAAVELEDPAGDVVEEVAVVGDRDDRALVLGEVLLQPGDRLGVEVVGRLVEQQQVGRAEQQPAERDAAALAAGERCRPRRRRAAGAARPSRTRAACRGSRRRRRRSCACRRGELVGGLLGVVRRRAR